MRVLYADTGLRGLEGHITSSAIALPPAFRRLGHDVTVLGHRDLVPSLREAIGAVPLFRFYTWGAWSADPFIGWLADFTEVADATLADLHRAWVELGPFDFVYFNTVRAAQLAAIGTWLKEMFPVQSGAPIVAVQLGPDPGLVRSGTAEAPIFAVRDPTTVLHRYAAHLVGKEWMQRLALVAVNKTVAEEYSFIVDLPVKTMTTPEELPTPRPRKRSDELVVGFLGYQRIDKGYELLPELIRQLLREHSNIRFLVQHSDPSALAQEHPERNLEVTAKLRELAHRSPRVELVLQPVIGADWFKLIDRCDMVALPYDPVRYASSYSAIFGEALASGAVIVAPGDTTMATEIETAGGVGVSFSQWTAASVASAISQAVANFGDLAQRAYGGGVAWRARHGPDAYVAQLLETAGAAGDSRSASGQGARTAYKLPLAFLNNPQLQNGASILPAINSIELVPGQSRGISVARNSGGFLGRRQRANDEAIDVMHVAIETTTTPWHYALTFDIDANVMGKLPPQSQLIAEAMIEVGSGIVGIGWLDREQQLVSTEQFIVAKHGTQRTTVSARSDQAHRLMLRNATPDGRKAAFTLKSLITTASA